MTICPSCGRENADNRDFCECGEYLRWEPTQHVQAVKPSVGVAEAGSAAGPQVAPGPPPDPDVTLAPGAAPIISPPMSDGDGQGARAIPSEAGPPPPGAATLVLRLPDDEGEGTGPVRVSVKPGERVTVLGLIRNDSGIVDNYDLSVTGMPPDWWTVAPPIAYLVPYGTSGNYEQEFQVHLHPPRTPEAQAEPWSVEVVATSRAYRSQVASAPAIVQIEPYQDLGTKVAPDRAAGRLKARFVLTVRNRANAPAEVLLDAQDMDGKCEFRFADQSARIEPGRGLEAPFIVFPPKQIWIGRPLDHQLRVTATAAGDEQPPLPVPVIYRQRAWLPWWMAVVAPIIAALIVLFVLLQPKQTLVPNVKGAKSVFAAQRLLTAAGLKLNPMISQRVSTTAGPGTIIAQDPMAGKKAKAGSFVSVVVAVGSGLVPVPSVQGMTPVAADTALRMKGLVLGQVSPAPNPNGHIASQIPAANVEVKTGTPIAVFLEQPTPAKTTKSGTTGSAGGATGGAGAGSGGSGGSAAKAIVIPPVSGTQLTVAQKLSQLGLVPYTSTRIDPAPAGSVIGTDPVAGAHAQHGAKIAVFVSAGYPDLSYDDGTKVSIINGYSGKPAATLPSSAQPQDEAGWSADGSHIVYVQGPASGGQLWLYAPFVQGAQPRALTPANSNYADPSFAPTTRSHFLAFIQPGTNGDKLCFATVGPNMLNSDCTSHPGWKLGHISWSPDGMAILVFGQQVGKQGVFGLIEFKSNVPFSTQASNWGQGSVVTDISHSGQGVIDGEFSPDGKQVALVSNLGTSDFHVFLAAANDLMMAHATALPVHACQVAWRGDGQQLALMQADSACSQADGDIVEVNPSSQRITETPIATVAANPQWRPVSPGG
jgi:beta-lactam-binding protein with PASTA domain